jgi:hypothetical protein
MSERADDRIDEGLRAGFDQVRLPPERLAALVQQASPRRPAWQGWAVAVAAAAVLAVALGLLTPSGDPAPAAPAAPTRDVIEVPAGMRAVTLEAGRTVSVLVPMLQVGGRVDLHLVQGGPTKLEALLLGEGLTVLGTTTDEGLLTVAASPKLAEQLVHGLGRGVIVPVVDLGRGQRAVALEIDRAAMTAGLVAPGARIDLLLGDGASTRTVAEGVEVLSVDDDGWVVVATDPLLAGRLVFGQQAGHYTASLRGG